MKNIITIKGVGLMSVKPDYVEINVVLRTFNKNYEKAYKEAVEKNQKIIDLITKISFKKEDLKTRNFNVNSEYESVTDEKGRYKNVFTGYTVIHELKLAFDMEMDRLSEVMVALSESQLEPELNIRFTIKNPKDISAELLKLATEDAKKKAKILCEAAGKTLGELINIDYTWTDINLYSDSDYSPRMMKAESVSLDMEAEEIKLEDTVDFVWELK